MKRWLLVRDGCPICRRLYLGGGTKLKSVVPAPHDDEGANGVNGDGGMESERDLESGVGGNAIITIEEEWMNSAFGRSVDTIVRYMHLQRLERIAIRLRSTIISSDDILRHLISSFIPTI